MGAALYRTIWRWHFHAGLLVIPFILMLSVTGAIYLFKPDLDRWQERAWHGLPPVAEPVSGDARIAAALAAVPGATFTHYRLPERSGDAAVIHVGLPAGGMRDVAVSADGRVLAIADPEAKLSALVATIHGSLMLGMAGRLMVELAASWAIIMILTGLYLWWPRGKGLAGIVWPRLTRGGRTLIRDLHAVTGFWTAGLALILLFTALPWTDVWATGFRAVRAQMGWVQGTQQWKGGIDPHDDHDHAAMLRAAMAKPVAPSIDRVLARAMAERMPHPALLIPPGAKMRFGSPNGADWKLTSEAQNRPLVRSATYDPATGMETSRTGFADKHPLDRLIGYGIAWHEGHLVGRLNQAIGVLTAIGLITLAISGTMLWWRRRPTGRIGAPPAPSRPVRLRGVAAITVLLALFLPLLGASLVLLALIDRLAMPIWRRWQAA